MCSSDLGSMAGPMALLFNISENVTEQNDSASVAKETRLMKTLKHMLKERGYKSKLGTKMGKISNKGLSKLSKKGITPLNEDGSKFDIGKKGYPDNQPAKYDVDGKTIKKDELVDLPFLKASLFVSIKTEGFSVVCPIAATAHHIMLIKINFLVILFRF